MTDDSSQLEMLGNQGAKLSAEAEHELAKGCRDRHHALVKCYEVSNLTQKQLYGPLGIEQSLFSRILNGTAFLNPKLKFQWMAVCGNLIPLRYDALMCNQELVPIRTTAEERIAALEAELADERRLNGLLVQRLRA